MAELLAGRKAIVTGSSRGIGRATALELARRGADVLVNYKTNAPAADSVVAEIGRMGRKALAVQASVSDRQAVEAMFATAERELGTVDVLVNNAGVVADALLPRLGENEWDEVMDTNLKGAFHCSKAAMRIMIRRRGGCIINVASLSGVSGRRGQCNYAASKGGMIALTKSLAQEAGSFGIRVNAVAPGPIQTDVIDALGEEAFDLESIALRRLGRPEEVASVVAFLASDMASYMTGAVLYVNGGLYM